VIGVCATYAIAVDSRTFMEAAIVQHVRDWVAGRLLYGDLGAEPYNLAVYGPLYYALIAPFARVSATWGALVGVRTVCLASILATFYVARAILRALSVEGRVALFALFALSFGILWPVSGPMWPASALEIAGLALFCRADSENRAPWLAYGLFVLATLVKQNAIGVVAGTFLVRLLDDRPRRGRVLGEAIGIAAVIVVVHGLVDLATHGAYHRALYLVAVVDSKSFWTAFSVTRGVILPGALAVGLAVAGRWSTSRVYRIVAGAGMGAAAVALVGVSKAGAGPAYYLSAILCVSCLATASLFERDDGRSIWAAVALALVVIPSRDQLSAWKQQLRDRHPYADVVALLRSAGTGPVVSELPLIAQLAGREAWVVDPYMYSLAAERHFVSNGFLDDLSSCRAAAVVLFREGYPAEPAFLLRTDGPARTAFLTALTTHYEERAGTREFRFFAPACRGSYDTPPAER
jgi:hypothetical protein